jgi:hypothetical protein
MISSAAPFRDGVERMHTRGFLILGLLGFALAAGCGPSVVVDSSAANGTGASGATTSSGSGGGPTFSCNIVEGTTSVCVEYENLPAADVATEQSACTSEQGTAGTSCSTENALGACTVSADGISVKEVFYNGGGITAAQAEQACTSSQGTWTTS